MGVQSFENEEFRLSASLSSRKALALDFIKRYFIRCGQSPSISEISATLGIGRSHAHRLVHELATEQMIEVVAGKTRGIRLIDRTEELSEADVLARLLAIGWTIGAGNVLIAPEAELLPAGQSSPTVAGLTTAFPVLHHPDGTDSRLAELPLLDFNGTDDVDVVALNPAAPSAAERMGPRGKSKTEK